MSKFWVGTVDEYERGVADGVTLDVSVKKHSPIYSPDGKEVLVKGFGDMTLEEVKVYQAENWVRLEEVTYE